MISPRSSDDVENPPHGSNDASESAEKHRGCKMNRLIRLLLAALRGLTCAQKREHGPRQTQWHDVLDCQPTIAQQERAFEGVWRLHAVASQVKNVRALPAQNSPQVLRARIQSWSVDDARRDILEALDGDVHLILDVMQALLVGSVSAACHNAGYLVFGDRTPILPRFSESGQRRSV
jgi:hypothetical protein